MLLSFMEVMDTEGVDGVTLVRIDGNTKESRVGVDELILVPHNRVPQDTGITKIGQVSHVLSTVIVSRVHLADCILLEHLHFSSNLDSDLSSILGLNQTFQVSTISFVRHPYALLWVVGLGLVLHLQLILDLQPGGWVRIRSRSFLYVSGHLGSEIYPLPIPSS